MIKVRKLHEYIWTNNPYVFTLIIFPVDKKDIYLKFDLTPINK
jgi:hypothetical protein